MILRNLTNISIPTGTIKSNNKTVKYFKKIGISIPTGTIKRPTYHKAIKTSQIFQFLLVRLKDLTLTKIYVILLSFQFLLVRLKERLV